MLSCPWYLDRRKDKNQYTTNNTMDKITILLAEDDEVLSKVVEEELTEAGFECFQAYDGEVSLRLAQEKKPDLILLDILMPKKNGFDVLEALKRSPETKEIPVIMLTMLGGDDDIKKGLRLGANDYIVKSQHALPEIVEKVGNFFTKEAHPKASQVQADQPEIPT